MEQQYLFRDSARSAPEPPQLASAAGAAGLAERASGQGGAAERGVAILLQPAAKPHPTERWEWPPARREEALKLFEKMKLDLVGKNEEELESALALSVNTLRLVQGDKNSWRLQARVSAIEALRSEMVEQGQRFLAASGFGRRAQPASRAQQQLAAAAGHAPLSHHLSKPQPKPQLFGAGAFQGNKFCTACLLLSNDLEFSRLMGDLICGRCRGALDGGLAAPQPRRYAMAQPFEQIFLLDSEEEDESGKRCDTCGLMAGDIAFSTLAEMDVCGRCRHELESGREAAAAAERAAVERAAAERAAAEAAAAQRAAEEAAERAAAEVAAAQRAAEEAAARRRARGLTPASVSPDGDPCDVSLSYLQQCTAGFSPDRHLGAPGAFGSVFRGVDGALGLRFAVKRLDPRAPWAPERSAQAEIAMLSRFRHEHIIRLWGFCAEGPAGHCLVYELGVRGALSDNLVDDAKAGELSWKTRLRIARGVASALSFLHRSEPPAWHRDIKAANVVLTASLQPKLIDCGLSKLLTPDKAARGALTATGGAAFGTPGYLCPVYCRRHRYEEASEVYSFGVLLLELITGKLQMGGDQRGLDLVDEVVQEGELPLHRDARAGAWPLAVVEGLEALATACVESKPAKRPSSLAVLRQLNRMNEQCASSAEEVLLRRELAAESADREALLAVAEATELKRPRRDCALPQCLGLCPEGQLTLQDGLDCAGGHFTCNACLTGYAEHMALASVYELSRCKGQLKCAACPANAPPFSAAAVAKRIPQAAYDILHAAIVRATEAATTAELENDFQLRLRAMERRLGENASVAQLRAHVVEEILTLHCPSCAQVFVDFAGCFALTCGRCSAGFCAWCLMHCARNAHSHVAKCQHNTSPGKEVFGTEAAFLAAQRQRRERMMRVFLAAQAPAIRAPLLRELATDLRDLGMDAAAFG